MAHSGEQHQPRTGDVPGDRAATGRAHQPVRLAVDDDGGGGDPAVVVAQAPAAENRAEMPRHAHRVVAAVVGLFGVAAQPVFKLNEGRPNCVDMIKNGEISLVVNTPRGMIPRNDENAIRAAAYANNVCIMTTITGAKAALNGIRAMKAKLVDVRALQLYKGSVVPM